MRNLRLKLWSVLIALCISYFVSSQNNASVITLVVPVELQNVPSKKIVLLPTSSQAQVKVQGPSYLFSDLVSSPPTFRIPYPQNTENRFTVRLRESFLDIHPALEVTSIDPPEIEYVLDDISEKIVPITIQRIGQVNNGLKLQNLVVNPPKVKVTGPLTEISTLQAIESDPIDLRSVKENERKVVPLEFPKFTKGSVDQVEVSIEVTAVQMEKTFRTLPIEIRAHSGEVVTTDPATAQVELSGASEEMAKLSESDVVPYVRVKPGSKVGSELKVQVDVPSGVSVVFVDPESVRIVNLETKKPVNAEKKKG